MKIPIGTITQDGNKLKFEIRSVGGSYAGALNETKTEITGEWTQLGQSAPLNLKKKQ